MTESKQLALFNGAQRERDIRISQEYQPEADVTLYHGDRLDLLHQIASSGDQASLIITSPPYNIGKEYEERTSLTAYIASQRETIAACLDILAPDGSICWQVGNYIHGSGKEKEVFPLDMVLYPVFKSFNLTLKNRVVWHFGHGLHESYRFSGRHETIMWFTRPGNDYTFDLDPVRVPQKYPGKRAFRGPKKGQLSGNPKGKNPSDVWDMPNVKNNHVEKTDHPCQFPVALVERFVLATTEPGDLVVDPYMGVGTTAAAAILHDRRAAGSDTQQFYLDIASIRMGEAWDGSLRTRPMNKVVYKPPATSEIAQRPEEWDQDE